jgi:anti-sigma factor RsiW
MTDARQGVTGCPDFESLSCYADGELEPSVAAGVAAHVDGCRRCAALAVRLRDGFEADDARRDGGIGGSGCVGEERLIVYATGAVSGPERADLAAHLVTCDTCIAALALLHRRLGAAALVDTPVPIDIQLRARKALEAAVRDLAPLAEPRQATEPRRTVLLHRVRERLRLPVLVPAALAAGALLMVANRSVTTDQSGPTERSRAVAPDAVKRRVTAVEATVRSRPSMQSDVVATVRRGTVAEITGEERDWYEVRIDGGHPGWVEREAFE